MHASRCPHAAGRAKAIPHPNANPSLPEARQSIRMRERPLRRRARPCEVHRRRSCARVLASVPVGAVDRERRVGLVRVQAAACRCAQRAHGAAARYAPRALPAARARHDGRDARTLPPARRPAPRGGRCRRLGHRRRTRCRRTFCEACDLGDAHRQVVRGARVPRARPPTWRPARDSARNVVERGRPRPAAPCKSPAMGRVHRRIHGRRWRGGVPWTVWDG
mmetsp:Transcript_47465/g.117511  ORF Transcript_47465/g.117511 Transcript_47465/m.117511 type:complete len:221 (-) Transcript_47465:434-1096(-)